MQCHQHTPSLSSCFQGPNGLAVDFEQVITLVIITVLFTNQIIICSTSAAHAPLVLSCLLNPSTLADDFEQFIVLAICLLPCLLRGNSIITSH